MSTYRPTRLLPGDIVTRELWAQQHTAPLPAITTAASATGQQRRVSQTPPRGIWWWGLVVAAGVAAIAALSLELLAPGVLDGALNQAIVPFRETRDLALWPAAAREIILTIASAAALGGERAFRRKRAGMSEFVHVSLIGCAATFLGAHLFPGGDPTRVTAYLFPAFGFAGWRAVVVLDRDGGQEGLTTAFALMVALAIGIAYGLEANLIGPLLTLVELGLLAGPRLGRGVPAVTSTSTPPASSVDTTELPPATL